MSAAPPANFNPEEAENLEDVRTSLPLNFTFPVQVAKLSADGEAICRQRFATSPSIPSNYPATDPTIAVQHMTTYWAILEKVRGSSLRLTKMDDEIYEHLKKDFPEFDPAATIDEDEMKSKTGKERWRKFMMAYEKKIDDYNFGTIIRSNPKWEYGQNETIFGKRSKWRFYWASLTCIVPRMQFYAIEIARNKLGLNDWIYEQNNGIPADNKAEDPKWGLGSIHVASSCHSQSEVDTTLTWQRSTVWDSNPRYSDRRSVLGSGPRIKSGPVQTYSTQHQKGRPKSNLMAYNWVSSLSMLMAR